MQTAVTQKLLSSDDPGPVEVANADSDLPVVLLCEHAGCAIPGALQDLGISHDMLMSHRGWDIGARAVALKVANLLNAPLVLQTYSRLVIDANRPPTSAGAIPSVSDGLTITANQNLSTADRERRVDEIFEPMNEQLLKLFGAAPRKACFSIHSFTPHLNGQQRPWNAGFLNRSDPETLAILRKALLDQNPDLFVANNEPYQIEDHSDWFIPQHAERRKLAHALIEIRNDQLVDEATTSLWGQWLATAITHVLEELA